MKPKTQKRKTNNADFTAARPREQYNKCFSWCASGASLLDGLQMSDHLLDPWPLARSASLAFFHQERKCSSGDLILTIPAAIAADLALRYSPRSKAARISG
jgi:hypothetical protein